MVNAVWVNGDHGRDFHPLTDHMMKLKIFFVNRHSEAQKTKWFSIIYRSVYTRQQNLSNLMKCTVTVF